MVLPAAYFGWWLALVAGIALHNGATALCPADQLDSGACLAPWFPWVEGSIFVFCAGLAAALVVLFATLMAPAKRHRVAWIVFAAGALFAGYLGFAIPAPKESAAALTAGLATASLITRRLRR